MITCQNAFLGGSIIKNLQDNEETFLLSLRDTNSIYDLICVPCGCRTTSEVRNVEEYSYVYQCPSQSGSVPVLCGILALGLQVRPDIFNDDLLQTLKDTSHIENNRFKIVNPKDFIQKLIFNNN